MKYLCDSCSRLVEAASFEVSQGVLSLRCPQCGGESSVGRAQEPRAAPLLELARPKPPPAGPLCPKCAAPRPEDAQACARCGLVFARFDPTAFLLPQPVEALWEDARQRWSDPGAHAAFLDACSVARALPEAVRRYRLQAESDPGDAVASAMREQATARLMAASAAPLMPDDAPAQTMRAGKALLALFALSVAAALGWLAFRILTARPH